MLIESTMQELHIPMSKIFVTVTDNGSNMVSAFTEVRQILDLDEETDNVQFVVEELDNLDESALLECKLATCFRSAMHA